MSEQHELQGSYGLNSEVTDSSGFYMSHDPAGLTRRFGSPLYIYNEDILRKNCRELKNMCRYRNFRVNFSVKANASLALMQIARQEGLCVDAMSPGEILAQLAAGYEPGEIFFIPNNVSDDEMKFALDRGILTSADSLSQLDRLGRLSPGGEVAFRLNPGIGDGHHKKVITGGDSSKFGINIEQTPQVKEILKKYSLRLKGINQHIGSHFMQSQKFAASVDILLAVAMEFEGLDFVDAGGGFGVPYKKQSGEARMDMRQIGELLEEKMNAFVAGYGREIALMIEPGRYMPAEAGILLGTVHSVKNNGSTKFVGTDIGFNVLLRPAMYDAHHDVEVYSENPPSGQSETVTIVGNICEPCDILAKNRLLPRVSEGDVIGVLDAGSYCFSMSSTYNMRPRPAEVLLRSSGEALVIRERDSLEDLLRNQRMI